MSDTKKKVKKLETKKKPEDEEEETVEVKKKIKKPTEETKKTKKAKKAKQSEEEEEEDDGNEKDEEEVVKKKKKKEFKKKEKTLNDVIELENLDVKDIIFGKITRNETVSDTGAPIVYFKMPMFKKVKVTSKAGKETEEKSKILLQITDLFSYGISEFINKKTGLLDARTFGVALYDREGATELQDLYFKKIEEITERIKEYIIECRAELEDPDMVIEELRKFSILRYSKDPTKGPSLSFKLKGYKEHIDDDGDKVEATMYSKFFRRGEEDEEGNFIPLDFNELISTTSDRRFGMSDNIFQIDDVYIGDTIKSVKLVLWESHYKVLEYDGRGKSLMRKKRRIEFNSEAKDTLENKEPGKDNEEKKGQKVEKKEGEKKEGEKKEGEKKEGEKKGEESSEDDDDDKESEQKLEIAKRKLKLGKKKEEKGEDAN